MVHLPPGGGTLLLRRPPPSPSSTPLSGSPVAPRHLRRVPFPPTPRDGGGGDVTRRPPRCRPGPAAELGRRYRADGAATSPSRGAGGGELPVPAPLPQRGGRGLRHALAAEGRGVSSRPCGGGWRGFLTVSMFETSGGPGSGRGLSCRRREQRTPRGLGWGHPRVPSERRPPLPCRLVGAAF